MKLQPNQLCYFLVFRLPKAGGPIHWDNPTGGLVMTPKCVCEGIPISDFEVAIDVIHQRYHCGPAEQLMVAEVFEDEEREKALELHDKWENEMRGFLELMECES